MTIQEALEQLGMTVTSLLYSGDASKEVSQVRHDAGIAALAVLRSAVEEPLGELIAERDTLLTEVNQGRDDLFAQAETNGELEEQNRALKGRLTQAKAELTRVEEKLAVEESYTNKYMGHLHRAEAERNELRFGVERLKKNINDLNETGLEWKDKAEKAEARDKISDQLIEAFKNQLNEAKAELVAERAMGGTIKRVREWIDALCEMISAYRTAKEKK